MALLNAFASLGVLVQQAAYLTKARLNEACVAVRRAESAQNNQSFASAFDGAVAH
ncbi:hypothetical protein SAMN03159340_03533 [Sphingomonas sp. NFR15]|nr:hypothetical protein SAMN03159340_03533 [Sphingomonas sp. NFR15]